MGGEFFNEGVGAQKLNPTYVESTLLWKTEFKTLHLEDSRLRL